MTTRRLSLLLQILAGGTILTGCILYLSWPGIVLSAFTLAIWTYGVVRHKAWAIQVGFALTIISSANAIFIGLPAFWALMTVLIAIAAWDLERFAGIQNELQPFQAVSRLQRTHYIRLAAALIVSLVIGSAALLIHWQLDFLPAFCLSGLAILVVAIGIRVVIRTAKISPPSS